MSPGPSTPLPSPRAHLASSLTLFDALADLAGGMDRFPGAQTWRRWVARPRALPVSVPSAANGLKCDGYITEGVNGLAWGFACNDRWEGRALWRVAQALADELDGDYAIGAAERLRSGLGGNPSLTISVGFDAPGQAPRLKLYLQEPVWGEGIGSVGELRALGRGVLGADIPDGLPEALRPGVITVGLHADGRRSLKLYLGGRDVQRLAAETGGWLPEHAEELGTLAAGMRATSPGTPSFHYLTLRLGGVRRVALNKIYEHERLGFGADRAALPEAWAEVEALFASAGSSGEALRALRRRLDGQLLVPTATALEAAGTSADVYVAAWPRE